MFDVYFCNECISGRTVYEYYIWYLVCYKKVSTSVLSWPISQLSFSILVAEILKYFIQIIIFGPISISFDLMKSKVTKFQHIRRSSSWAYIFDLVQHDETIHSALTPTHIPTTFFISSLWFAQMIMTFNARKFSTEKHPQ